MSPFLPPGDRRTPVQVAFDEEVQRGLGLLLALGVSAALLVSIFTLITYPH